MKKIISTIIAIVMSMSIGCISVFATNAPQGCQNYPIIENNELTSKAVREKLAIQEAYKEQAIAKKNSVTRDTATWTYLTGFTCVKQEQKGYCMPACAYSILKFLNNTSPSQSAIASAMGVNATTGGDFNNLAPYLNSMQDHVMYVQMDNSGDMLDMQYDLHSGVTIFEAPPVLRVDTSGMGSNWPYNSPGHALCVRGARSDWEQYQLADPLMKRLSSSNPTNYVKNASVIYTAISPAYCGYIY